MISRRCGPSKLVIWTATLSYRSFQIFRRERPKKRSRSHWFTNIKDTTEVFRLCHSLMNHNRSSALLFAWGYDCHSIKIGSHMNHTDSITCHLHVHTLLSLICSFAIDLSLTRGQLLCKLWTTLTPNGTVNYRVCFSPPFLPHDLLDIKFSGPNTDIATVFLPP